MGKWAYHRFGSAITNLSGYYKSGWVLQNNTPPKDKTAQDKIILEQYSDKFHIQATLQTGFTNKMTTR